jgi:hypothetical protein
MGWSCGSPQGSGCPDPVEKGKDPQLRLYFYSDLKTSLVLKMSPENS